MFITHPVLTALWLVALAGEIPDRELYAQAFRILDYWRCLERA